MLSLLTLAALLFGTWVVWSGYFSGFFFISGAVAVIIALYVAKRMSITNNNSRQYPLYMNPRAVLYCLWLAKEILISSFQTAKLIWQIKPDISPTIGSVPITQNCITGKALYANSITLTPGTVTMVTDDNSFLVHALCEETYNTLKEGEMDKRVTKVTCTLSGGKS